MVQRFLNLLRGLSAHWLGKLGVALATSSFLLFLFLELLRLLGVLTNTYAGLVTYMTLPLLFIVGLLLIPIGWQLTLKRTGLTSRELLDRRFDQKEVEARFIGSSVVGVILLLTLVNLVFLGGGSARMLHFMDSAEFCGTACHSVMNPEWVTYQASPHANVDCVECHVGEGAKALVDAKLNGLWQIVSATFDLYERPIPTPVHQLRPARETCEKCHWPEKFYGDRLKVIDHFAADSTNSATYSTLNLKVGSGSGEEGSIHWHVALENEVRYASVDDEREEMIWVEWLQPDGKWRRYENKRLLGETSGEEYGRTLDCVDCHNRATHIYEDPDAGLDARFASGELDSDLPWLKREALGAILSGWQSYEDAQIGVDNHIRGFYRDEYPELSISKMESIDRAVESLQSMVARNLHPGMNITWGAYESYLGHRAEGGCFRCHHENMVDEAGVAIDYDCTLCHSILAQNSSEPFRYLMPLDEKDPERNQAEYLREEFLRHGGSE
jgi:hypothetical protein